MTRPVLVCCALALVLAACSGGRTVPDQAAPTTTVESPSPSPSPSPTPTPVLAPVDGTVEITLVDVAAAGNEVFSGGAADAAPALDEGAVDAFAAAVKRWLDTHLDAVQRGGVGTIDPTSAFAAGADEATIAAVSSDLAGPDAPVEQARYVLEIGAGDAPAWASVDVVVHAGGSERHARFVFAPGSPQPVLLAASGGDA